MSKLNQFYMAEKFNQCPQMQQKLSDMVLKAWTIIVEWSMAFAIDG